MARKHRSERHWLNRDFGGVPGWGLVLAGLFFAGVGALWVYTSAQPAPASAYTPPPRVTETPSPTPDAQPVALFVGDSYTRGVGASDDEYRWSTLVAGELGWAEANYGRGGTGYVTDADFDGCGRDYCPPYPERIGEAVGDGVEADVVVIAGGQNDSPAWFENSDAVIAGIDATFAAARDAFPDARIVAVGPSWIGVAADWHADFDGAVQAAAQGVGADYVSLIDPPVLDDSMSVGDGAHVNDDGHAAIGGRVVAAVASG